MLLGGMTIEYSKVPADICLFSFYFFIKNTIFDKEKYKVQRESERQFFNEILYLYQEKMNFRILENKMSE